VDIFRDRADAGRRLAAELAHYANRSDVVVLGLPRGGVPVAYEVARALGAPLDLFVVRKLGVPGHQELAMGAVASGGVRVLNDEVVEQLHIPNRIVDGVTLDERRELERSERRLRGSRPRAPVRGRTTILVDDGLATGSSMRAAVAALRQQLPARVVVAVAVAPPSTCEMLRREADEVVCLLTEEPFYAVGLWFQDFSQLTDQQVRKLLNSGGTAAMHGRVDRLVAERGFGFIRDDTGQEYFFQRGALMGVDFEDLAPGTGVEFGARAPEAGDEPGEHPRAVSIRLADDAITAPDHERLPRQKTA
jgi:predicted phosphoribosyltransferase